ncbi:lipocalin family protein [Metapseudomonas furukawaii]|uniref:Outer membrane lipoprotein Blc n=1 Tax=Metapseudomonas furukawaii TaxID=1149133 RepID=A0AAD1C5G2_METFU|nr:MULTISPECIES: lipocalin family protein [Pseudomonas]ELS27140.1 outer membrane lipoprotein Blc [Pseudomonas furukawaii]OWJ95649.1 lipocalin [Pseudomonas sp. A46]BAU77033.1 outer membrane lipoprotein Blc [Pseudomonas furukawaii]
MRALIGAFLLALLAGCAGQGREAAPPRTVGAVDLERYQGTWYELARLPMFFQRDCAQSEAHYSLQADGSVGVLNRCRTLEGEWKEARGNAVPQVAGRTDRLWVRFDNWITRLLPDRIKGDYWVLYLDDGYRTALVGNPNRKYLWLLSRTPVVSEKTRQRLLETAEAQGYDTDRLIWRVADSAIAAP